MEVVLFSVKGGETRVVDDDNTVFDASVATTFEEIVLAAWLVVGTSELVPSVKELEEPRSDVEETEELEADIDGTSVLELWAVED